MRRLAVCAFVVLAAGLVLAPGARASTGVRHAALGAGHAAGTGGALNLGADPTYAISGHVLDYDGNGVQGAEVDWGWWDSNYNYQYGGSNPAPGTDATGAFAFPAVAGGSPQGDDLSIDYFATPPGLEYIDSWKLDFAANNDLTPYSYEIRPAHVNIDIANAPATLMPEVKVGEQDVGYAQSSVALTAGEGTASVLPPSFADVVAYYVGTLQNCTAQVESLGPSPFPSPVSVAAGTTAADTVDLDWAAAKHAYLAGPTCQHSGKPGTKVKVVLKNWPATEQAGFVAWYGAGEYDYSASVTSTGAGQTYTTPLQIRTNAPVDLYEIDTYRTDAADSLVGLWDYFQVCTFKASASAIHHGKTVRLSGKVWAVAGKKVTVYSRTKAAGQPATLAAKGWHKVGTYKTKSGKFVTGLLHPTRTTWYVTKYTGYDFPAFTSVIKVTVH